MATTFKTPGVYVYELNAFPNSVVPVATAIPAFIGYTQLTVSAASQSQDLKNVATQITSLKQFEDYFGTSDFGGDNSGTTDVLTFNVKAYIGHTPTIPLSLPPYPVVTFQNGTQWEVTPTGNAAGTSLGIFYLHRAVQLFYLNGGGECYIISLGTYGDAAGAAGNATPVDTYTTALNVLELLPDPTMVLCPDALQLDEDNYYMVLQMVLAHCSLMQNRVALMDLYGGSTFTAGKDPSTTDDGPVKKFRDGIGQNNLNYGIAYYPWVNTSLIAQASLDFRNFTKDTLDDLGKTLDPNNLVKVPEWGAANPNSIEIFTEAGELVDYFNGTTTPLSTNFINATGKPLTPAQVQAQLLTTITAVNNVLLTSFSDYNLLLGAIATYLNINPVAAAMAGVITAVDANIGVWKAPANVSLNAVISPTVDLNDFLQADMNVDAATGKSVNAIRTFRGLGTLVWGARTLDGNSQDWRYINVRRTMIFIEQSIKLAVRAYVFAPNTANTWTNVKSMVSAFLYNIWKQGALAGATPGDAYSVQIGLGVTMTADDVLNGLMNLTVLVAVSHPAEFIQLTFQQQLQKS